MPLFSTNKQPQIIRSVSYPQRAHTVRFSAPAKPKKPYKALSFVVVAVGILGTVVMFNHFHKSNSQAPKSESAKVATVAAKPLPPKKLDFTVMNSTISAAIQQYPLMDIGVSVIDIKTGDAENYGVQNPFEAASTAKLLTAITYLHDVEQGKDTLSQPVGTRTGQEALKAMIINSDNEAWNDFNNGLMSHAELSAYAAKIGLKNYNPDSNTITPASIALLLSDLYQEKLISHQHTQLLLSYMLQAKEVEYITDAVPAGTKVYHKPGYLGDRVNDAAIVDNGSRPYVLVIFSKSRTDSYNTTQGAALFKQITLATLAVFSK